MAKGRVRQARALRGLGCARVLVVRPPRMASRRWRTSGGLATGGQWRLGAGGGGRRFRQRSTGVGTRNSGRRASLSGVRRWRCIAGCRRDIKTMGRRVRTSRSANCTCRERGRAGGRGPTTDRRPRSPPAERRGRPNRYKLTEDILESPGIATWAPPRDSPAATGEEPVAATTSGIPSTVPCRAPFARRPEGGILGNEPRK